jgi:hypothetical protein
MKAGYPKPLPPCRSGPHPETHLRLHHQKSLECPLLHHHWPSLQTFHFHWLPPLTLLHQIFPLLWPRPWILPPRHGTCYDHRALRRGRHHDQQQLGHFVESTTVRTRVSMASFQKGIRQGTHSSWNGHGDCSSGPIKSLLAKSKGKKKKRLAQRTRRHHPQLLQPHGPRLHNLFDQFGISIEVEQ